MSQPPVNRGQKYRRVTDLEKKSHANKIDSIEVTSYEESLIRLSLSLL